MNIVERVGWQAAFGSDAVREALCLFNIRREHKNPILLFMPKKRNPLRLPTASMTTGRRFRTEDSDAGEEVSAGCENSYQS